MADKRQLIKLIHVAKSKLGMDDDSYRAILAQHGRGMTSSKDLSVVELDAVLGHMKRCGFKVIRAGKSRAMDTGGQLSKIRALWLDLHAFGSVRDPSEKALAAFVHRMTGVEALQWLTGQQASKVIEELKRWRQRLCHAGEKHARTQ